MSITINKILKRINTTPCNGQLTADLINEAKKLGYKLEGFNYYDGYKNHWRYKITN